MLSFREELAGYDPLAPTIARRMHDEFGVSYHALFISNAWWTTRAVICGRRYQPTDEMGKGARVLVIPIVDDEGEITDLVAVNPLCPAQFGSRDGVAAVLGDPNTCPCSDGELPVHRTPMNWLRADCNGVVILRPKATWRALAHAPNLLAEDIPHGKQLKKLMCPPPWKGQIRVPRPQEMKAAA